MAEVTKNFKSLAQVRAEELAERAAQKAKPETATPETKAKKKGK